MILQVLLLLVALLLTAAILVLGLPPLRRVLLSRSIFKTYKSILPQMSETERDALEAGTVWWEGELFQGDPDWNKLLAYPVPAGQPASGLAVLVCPGGGYRNLAFDKEGTDVARFLNSFGCAAFVLKYPMPGSAEKMNAIPTANETAPPGRPATFTSTSCDNSAMREGAKPIAVSVSADNIVLIAK